MDVLRPLAWATSKHPVSGCKLRIVAVRPGVLLRLPGHPGLPSGIDLVASVFSFVTEYVHRAVEVHYVDLPDPQGLHFEVGVPCGEHPIEKLPLLSF